MILAKKTLLSLGLLQFVAIQPFGHEQEKKKKQFKVFETQNRRGRNCKICNILLLTQAHYQEYLKSLRHINKQVTQSILSVHFFTKQLCPQWLPASSAKRSLPKLKKVTFDLQLSSPLFPVESLAQAVQQLQTQTVHQQTMTSEANATY